jgi:hypothetical protein
MKLVGMSCAHFVPHAIATISFNYMRYQGDNAYQTQHAV